MRRRSPVFPGMACRIALGVLSALGTLGMPGSAAGGQASTRVAFLPSFTDFDSATAFRLTLPQFDARLQAELLAAFEAEVLARAGLSAVVFEQKLRTATEADAPPMQVLPADVLVLTILDVAKRQLRVHVNRVGPGMKLGAEETFPIANPKQLGTILPLQVARHVASVAGLAPRKAQLEVSAASERDKLVCAVLDPVSSSGQHPAVAQMAPVLRAVLEQALSDPALRVELVERTAAAAALLEERALSSMSGAWNPNAASALGRLAKADLVLVPSSTSSTPGEWAPPCSPWTWGRAASSRAVPGRGRRSSLLPGTW